MKESTVNIITWIKKQINLAKYCCIDSAWNGNHKQYNEDYSHAMKFLDSLPQIESRLCHGGYIQDKNEIPCCENDNVNFKIINYDTVYGEILKWNRVSCGFEIEHTSFEKIITNYPMNCIEWIKKVEI